MSSLRNILRVSTRYLRPHPYTLTRSFSVLARLSSQTRKPPTAPEAESAALQGDQSPSYLGTIKRLPEFSLADKVVCVSGAGRGLGLVQAEALLEAGAKVYALDRLETPSPDFDRIASRAQKELGTSLSYRRIDVRDVDSLNSIIKEIAQKEGRMDGLIAAAGIQQETSALEYTAKDVDLMMSVNVTGVFMTAQAVAKQMLKFGNGGSIVLIASMSGTVANKGLICPAYNASKSAVLQLARNLASEWGEHGIRVNTISPGYIVTAMVEELFEKFPERRIEWPKQNMLGRLSKPEEYRGAAVFLLSGASSFMTGADLRMDGGHASW
ncbi:oxidoreductase [Sclerotinia borealis F-4128]|uniref:Oxidoreductase n=1 Tax=Sclerotinia borealis (strain F-4128) TaxID=1432307 RepID=W9C427_SCLBF|nr:oxidoreductase [Sclerotinia borealis F-4128]